MVFGLYIYTVHLQVVRGIIGFKLHISDSSLKFSLKYSGEWSTNHKIIVLSMSGFSVVMLLSMFFTFYCKQVIIFRFSIYWIWNSVFSVQTLPNKKDQQRWRWMAFCLCQNQNGLKDVHVLLSGTSVGMTPVLNNSLLFSISAPRALAGSISVSISFEKV